MSPKDFKRLAEADSPIAEVSKHAAREKSIRHGYLGTLHLWRAWPATCGWPRSRPTVDRFRTRRLTGRAACLGSSSRRWTSGRRRVEGRIPATRHPPSEQDARHLVGNRP